jgi:hypothetical protein
MKRALIIIAAIIVILIFLAWFAILLGLAINVGS